MGGLGNCFKSRKQEEENKPQQNMLSPEDKAIFECKKCRDKLKAYITRLENNAAKQKNKAKEHLKNKNRERAKMCLNQSKFYSTQVETASNQLMMITDQIIRIETTRSQKETMDVLAEGNKVLKELQKDVNIEKWEQIAEDMDDLKANQEEIGNFLKSHNVNMDEYEDGLNKDLENLIKQEGVVFDTETLPEPSKKELVQEKAEEKLDKKEEHILLA